MRRRNFTKCCEYNQTTTKQTKTLNIYFTWCIPGVTKTRVVYQEHNDTNNGNNNDDKISDSENNDNDDYAEDERDDKDVDEDKDE